MPATGSEYSYRSIGYIKIVWSEEWSANRVIPYVTCNELGRVSKTLFEDWSIVYSHLSNETRPSLVCFCE